MPIRILFFAFFISLLIFGCKEEDKEALQKISPELRATLLDLEKTGKTDKPITVVFRVNDDLTDLHYDVLKRKEVKIIANIGPIFSATLPAHRVVDLAKMKFVDHIQGERKFKATPSIDTSGAKINFKEKKK